MHQILINGNWVDSNSTDQFQPTNPTSGKVIDTFYPVSSWHDIDAALESATTAFAKLQALPVTAVADFLADFADRIDASAAELVRLASQETGLPESPRLANVELPRTTNQLRQAALAARKGSWAMPTIDTKNNIRSCYQAIGPVAVFGPNNFPFAFGSLSGGDFAAAIAAGNPVIGKANSSHPGTTRLFAELALDAAKTTGLPAGTVQLIYRTSHSDGEKFVADSRLGAVGYTGSRTAGLKLKSAADRAGKPIYLELSSINPVVILPHAIEERASKIADEFVTSSLMGAGQFCTNPGLVLLLDSEKTTQFITTISESYGQTPTGTLLSPSVENSLAASVERLKKSGAQNRCGGHKIDDERCTYANTILTISGQSFLSNPTALQTEAFGNATLFVVCRDVEELLRLLDSLEGNLTGCIYSHTDGKDDTVYDLVVAKLTHKVGRLLNDKMPTGVAVSSAMNHGGPFPATGHPGFSAVGIPGSIFRFAKLTCYDNVRHERLPSLLKDNNPTGETWRLIDENWTQQ